MQRQLCDIDRIVLSYIYNRPFEGKPNADVAQDETEFNTPGLQSDSDFKLYQLRNTVLVQVKLLQLFLKLQWNFHFGAYSHCHLIFALQLLMLFNLL